MMRAKSRLLATSASSSSSSSPLPPAAAAAVAAGLLVTALRRHVPRDFRGPFQDGSLVVAMQDLSLLSLSLFLSFS